MRTNYYLSRVEINPQKRGARKLLGSAQAMHAAVAAAFPPSYYTEGPRPLWRLDRQGPRAELFVVSGAQPDFTHLVEQAGWISGETKEWATKSYDRFLDNLESGQVWGFRFTGNPVRQGRTESGETKKFGHVTAAQQTQWFKDRAPKNGFDFVEADDGVETVELVARGDLRFRRRGNPGQVFIRQATFEGALVVRDPDQLREALTQGIGRAKAYGCGLLTLAPVSLEEVP